MIDKKSKGLRKEINSSVWDAGYNSALLDVAKLLKKSYKFWDTLIDEQLEPCVHALKTNTKNLYEEITGEVFEH